MIDEGAWIRWALRSARNERDLESVLIDTGVDAVDGDHRVLLRYAVELNRNLDGATGVDERTLATQEGLIDRFTSYAKYHFDREEALVERLRLPGLERQRREHARILETLDELAAEFRAGRTGVPADLRGSVFSWVVAHIAESDMETFRTERLLPALADARGWEDLADIVRTTGVDALDAEHRRIVTLIIEASQAMAADPRSGGLDALRRLREAAAGHFSHEEELLARFGAANEAAQRGAHARFLATIDARIAERAPAVPDGETESRAPSLELLSWFTDHIGRMDYDSFRRGGWMATAFDRAGDPAELHGLIRATGLSSIDDEHRRFVDLSFAILGAFGTVPRAGTDGPPAAAAAIGDLARFAHDHFAHEERLFAAAPGDYPPRLVARHRDEHRGLEEALGGLVADAAAARIGISDALRTKLVSWWISHTNGTDIETFGSGAWGRGGPP